MRTIRKGEEPRELREHRASAHATYKNLTPDAQAALRRSLAREQGHLCCYCMAHINPEPDHTGKVTRMKIEHWLPQSDEAEGADHQLDYRNLLGACAGTSQALPVLDQTDSWKRAKQDRDAPPNDTHCDTHKGNQRITIDPRSPSPHPDRLRYKPDGSIETDDLELHGDIEQRLNLNTRRLKANRKEEVDRFMQGLNRFLGPSVSWKPKDLQRELERLQQPGRDGRRLPYAGAIEYWLRKRIGKMTTGS